jgi:hypothetical protein
MMRIETKGGDDFGIRRNNNCNDDPIEMISNPYDLPVPHSPIFLLAVVLPLDPFVEDAHNDDDELNSPANSESNERISNKSRHLTNGRAEAAAERQALQIDEGSFEASLSRFVSSVLVPLKFEVLSVSRVPYLSQGDVNHSLYTLDDAILVLRAI